MNVVKGNVHIFNSNFPIYADKYISPVWEQKMSNWRSLSLYAKALLQQQSFETAPPKTFFIEWENLKRHINAEMFEIVTY